MMTLEQIRNIGFHKVKRDGYQPEEVDTFIDDVVSTFEAVFNERTANKKKIDELEKELAACRERESSIGSALLTAQHQADMIIGEAQSRADLVLEEAKAQANAVVASTRDEADRQKQALEQMKQEVASFKGRLLQLYREHLTLIDAIPDTRAHAEQKADEAAPEEDHVAPEAAAQPEPAAAAAPQPAAPAVPTAPVETDTEDDGKMEDLSSTSAPAAPAQANAPTLFVDDDDDFAPPQADRYQSLQFGNDYEQADGAARGGLFHRGKK